MSNTWEALGGKKAPTGHSYQDGPKPDVPCPFSVDLVLLGVLLFTVGRQQFGNSEKGSVTSDSMESPPQLPPLSPIQHHRISLPYPPPEALRLARNQHIPPTIFHVPSEDEPRLSNTTDKQLPPSPSPSSPTPPPAHRVPSYTVIDPTTGRVNRINLILALAHLQDPCVGIWAPTSELTALLEAWAGGRRLGAINSTNYNNNNNIINLNIGGQGHGNNGNSQSYGHGATALAHACLIDLCQTVWTAQREGREAAVLSAEELRTLEGLGWDLGWVAARIRRAGEFLERRRR
ncbi:hypothetical protein P885DRAFT_66126 [Corynascus similis CBS 632.67]